MRTSIYAKIFSIAIGLILLMVVVAIASSVLVNQVRKQLDVQSELLIPLNHTVAEIETNVLQQEVQIERLYRLQVDSRVDHEVLEDSRADLQTLHDQVENLFVGARDLIETEQPRVTDADVRIEAARALALLQGIEQEYRNYYGDSQRIIDLIHEGEEVGFLDELVAKEEVSLYRSVDELRLELDRFIDDAARSSAERETWLGIMVLVMTGGAILLGLPAAAIVTRGLVAPVKRLTNGVEEVRSGNLNFEVAIKSHDEIGQLATGFKEMVAGLRAKQRITETFGTYVDPRVVERLIEDPEAAKAGGDRRVMTVFFSDIADFTKLSTDLTAPALLKLLNRYFALMTAPIRASGGVIDKYIGDAIMAYWGPPFVDPTAQANAACDAIQGQLSAIGAFGLELPELLGIRANVPEVRMRIGLATGPLVVGTVGSEVSRNYTVIGDTVNLAARLEAACKLYGVPAIVDNATRRSADRFAFRELDSVRVAEGADPVRIFELRAAPHEDQEQALVSCFEQALADYRARSFERAEGGFRRCLEIDRTDGPSSLFLDRLARLRVSPPDDGWDGVSSLTK